MDTKLKVREDKLPAAESHPNGKPGKVDAKVGMTAVASRSMAPSGPKVKMRHFHGNVADVEPGDVEAHKRAGWRVVEDKKE